MDVRSRELATFDGRGEPGHIDWIGHKNIKKGAFCLRGVGEMKREREDKMYAMVRV